MLIVTHMPEWLKCPHELLPSGSTGFPKIRHWTHHLTLQYACGPCKLFPAHLYSPSLKKKLKLNIGVVYGERDLTGLRFGVHAVPIYHAMGILIVVFAVRKIVLSLIPITPSLIPVHGRLPAV